MKIQLFSIILFSILCFEIYPQTYNTGSSATERFIYTENGRLYYPDGNEVALWGVNLQAMISWEYKAIMEKAGIKKDASIWKKMVDEALDELEIMKAKVWRVHLTPADFTDARGNLVETIYLDLLDYTLAKASKRGIYAYITFLNHMGNYEVAQSFMQTSYQEAKTISDADKKHFHKAILMFDDEYREYSVNYTENLLQRVNPYSGTAYKNDTSIAVWEIMNEPSYLDYSMLKLYNNEYENYKDWLSLKELTEENGVHYPEYRKEKVLQYINRMYDVIRNVGASQPVAWNCNWHKMIIGKEDVFEAIAESRPEVISFCNYPGQSVASKDGPYWENPMDLSLYDYTSWYRECYENRNWYGWALEDRFSGKAKIVYEFETFYNQSTYLYPVMADFFRSMGVQIATMWHYAFSAYAPFYNGSHFLNLKCTPGKAASFAVASGIFQNTPVLNPYHSASPTEYVADSYMFSYNKNLSIFSNDNEYITSGTIYSPEIPEPQIAKINHITGYGSSPVVKYCGSGVYDILISDNEIHIHIEPNSGWLLPPWEKDNLKETVTQLDYKRKYLMEIRLNDWNAETSLLFRTEDEIKLPRTFTGNRLKFIALPGDYIITRE